MKDEKLDDPINYCDVKILELTSLNKYLMHNLQKPLNDSDMQYEIELLREKVKKAEQEKNSIVNSKTYRISLIMYKVYRTLFWWRK